MLEGSFIIGFRIGFRMRAGPTLMDEFDISTRPLAIPADMNEIVGYARRLCSMFGTIRAINAIADRDPVIFYIEFDSIDAANRAVQVLQSQPAWSLSKVSTHPYVL